MPQLKPGTIDSGDTIQTLKFAGSAPTAPYVLTAVVPLAPEAFSQFLAVRKAESGGVPTDWFYTETERIARIHGINYYEIKAYIDSGTATSFKLDRLDSKALSITEYDAINHDATRTQRPGVIVDALAWQVLHGSQIRLRFLSPAGPGSPLGTVDVVNIAGGFGQSSLEPTEEGSVNGRMWSNQLVPNGWYRRGRILQTVYKHVPVRVGGKMGYLHVCATIQAGTHEILFEINWHNAGIEERTGGVGPVAAQGDDLLESGGPQPTDDSLFPISPFGRSLVEDILVHSIIVEGLVDLPIDPDIVESQWTWSSFLMDGANHSDPSMRPSSNHLLKPISESDPNRVHCMPITFERPFRFIVHPAGVTPSAKWKTAVCDWSKPLGGWMFTPLGLPDLTALGSGIAGMSLTTEGTANKVALRTLQPWKGDEPLTPQNNYPTVGGLVSSDPLWPGAWDAYGGSTSGTGMTPFVGAKQAWIGDTGGFEILFCHLLRDRARTYGALYYNISGMPVLPTLHAIGGVEGPWDRFDRRFLKSGSGANAQIWDFPWFAARAEPRKIHLADYNPGPQGGATPTDAQHEPVINRPDWYLPGEGQAALALDALTLGDIALANFSQALGYTPPPGDLVNLPGTNSPDLAVPVLFQITGATTFGTTKAITFRITGTGEFDVEVVEDVTLTGIGTAPNAPAVQAKASLGKFKNVYSIEVTNITGTPVATEFLTIGRQSVGIADYFGSNGITALDDQHSVRYHAAMKALFLLRNNPLAFIYLMMDGSDARMVYWEGTGRARKLSPFDNAAPGRGNVMPRNWAFAADRIATAMAIAYGISPPNVVDSLWDRWRQAFRTNIVNSVMPANGLFQAPREYKEIAFQPFGAETYDFDGGNESKFFHIIATRETSYFSYALLMMGYVYGHFDQGILDACKSMARGFLDLLWKVQGSVAQGPHVYFPVAYRTEAQQSTHPRTGALWNRIKRASEPPLASDVWVIFSNQASLPAENPLSKAVLAPSSYPTPTSDRFVAEIAGDAAALGGGAPGGAMSALTLANADANGAQQPVPVTLQVNTGATFTNAKRRTFKVTGTDPWGVPIDDDCLGAERNGSTLPRGQTHFVTVLAHTFPVASRIGMTVLGGTTFVGSQPTPNNFTGKVFSVTFAGTSSSGQSIQETVLCVGQGTPKQFFSTNNYFKTVGLIGIVPLGTADAVSTEKFRWGTRQTYLVALGNAQAQQNIRLWQNFKTITEIIALTSAQAIEHGLPNLGTLVAGEKFRFGFQNVGLRQSIPGGGPLDPEAFQTGYALACWKFLGAPEADELIKRYTGEDGSQGGGDTLAAAKAEMLTWGEYSGAQPGGAPYCQWAPLLQQIRDA